jgi:hypothetical protein
MKTLSAKQQAAAKWNDGYYAEGMDRCHCVRLMLQELLEGHPAITKLPNGSQNIRIIDRILGELYQGIGKMQHKETGK